MIGTGSFKSPIGAKTGISDIYTFDSYSLGIDKYRIAIVIQGAVQGQVGVQIKSKTDLWQEGIPVGTITRTG